MSKLNSNRTGHMVLYSSPHGQDSHRVRLILAEKAISFKMVEVTGQPPTEMMEINPYGSLPTLCYRGLVLYETRSIMEYLNERFPHPPLLPSQPDNRGLIRQQIYRIDLDWIEKIRLIEQRHKLDVSPSRVFRLRKRMSEELLSIVPFLDQTKYFLGDEFTLLDCCMAVLLWRLDYLNITLKPDPATNVLHKYMRSLFSREAFKRSLSAAECEMRR